MPTAIAMDANTTGVTAGTSGNTLQLTSLGYGSGALVSVNVLSGLLDNVVKNVGNSTTNISNGTDVAGTVNGTTATGNGNEMSLDNADLSMNMTLTPNVSGAIAFTITGGGAVFQTGPTVGTGQQARLGITGVSTTTLGGTDGALYSLASNGTASLATNATTAAAIINEAATQVTSLRGRLGAFQQSTLNSNINSLNDAVQNLTSAKSSIQDTDFAAASAELTRAQVLVQSGTAVLSIANHLPDNVLALLKQ
jgi:flagellin